MSTANNILQPVTARGWLRGFGNLLDRERHLWLGTRKGLVQLLVWILLINGTVALMGVAFHAARSIPEERDTVPNTPEEISLAVLQTFVQIATLCTSIGAVISAQGTIIQEKQMGTAAWVLSKPVSRIAFVVTKLMAHTISYLVLAILMPTVILYPEMLVLGGRLPALPGLLAAMGVWFLIVLFYLTLTMMLGTFFNSRGVVLGGGLGFMFAGQILPSLWPNLAFIFPWPLGGIALMLALGPSASQPLPLTTIIPLIATVAWIVIFIAVAIWRFSKEEF